MTDRLIHVVDALLDHHPDDPRLVRMAASAVTLEGDEARDLALALTALTPAQLPADVSAQLRSHPTSAGVRCRAWERHSAHLTATEWEAGVLAETERRVLGQMRPIAPLAHLSDDALWHLLEAKPGTWNKTTARRVTTSFDLSPSLEGWWVAAMKQLPPESGVAQEATRPVFYALLSGYAHDLVVDDEDIPPAYRLVAACSPVARPGELTQAVAAYEKHAAAGYEKNTSYVQRMIFEAWATASRVPLGRADELHDMVKLAQVCVTAYPANEKPDRASEWRTLVNALEETVTQGHADDQVFLIALNHSVGWLPKDRADRLRNAWHQLSDEARTDKVCAELLVKCSDVNDLCVDALTHLGARAEEVLDHYNVLSRLAISSNNRKARPWQYLVSQERYLTQARRYGAVFPTGAPATDMLREERSAVLLHDLRTNPQLWAAHAAASVLKCVDATADDWRAMPPAVVRELMSLSPSQTRTAPVLEALASCFPTDIDGPTMAALAQMWESDVPMSDAYAALAGL